MLVFLSCALLVEGAGSTGKVSAYSRTRLPVAAVSAGATLLTLLKQLPAIALVSDVVRQSLRFVLLNSRNGSAPKMRGLKSRMCREI